MKTPTPPVQVDAAALRAAGRTPPLPATLALVDGRTLELERALRVLPGKRLVAQAQLDDECVLAKLFIADGAERHLRREREGIAALEVAAIPTPERVAEVALTGGGWLLATRFLTDAKSLDEAWRHAPHAPGEATALAVLAPALALLARMHHAGLAQRDLHLGNFLDCEGRLFVIDGDSVESHPAPLAPEHARANLAILLAQLPPAWDARLDALLEPYVAAGGPPPPHPALLTDIRAVRQRRLDDILAKSVRDCTLFAVERNLSRFRSVVRDEAAALAPLLAAPDAFIAAGHLLKNGNSATVAQVELDGRALVVKRYNLKSAAHAASRLLRPSRAWHAWRAAHRLRFIGVGTPRPLAMIEARIGPLRRRAWLVSEHSSGRALGEVLDPEQPPPAPIADALLTTFGSLREALITHGDLKASNLLWQDDSLMLIDLDATTVHHSHAAFTRAWRRDRARLLRNWAPDSVLHHWLEHHLPAAAE